MSILQGATYVAITGGTQVAVGTVNINQSGQAGVSSAFKDLSAAVAHTALHDSSVRFDAPRCHRNTRTAYLDALERWMLGVGGEYADARLIWLTGGAGAGKSAIMQSIVERCAQYAIVLGTFFFSRADPSRNFAEVLIPTLSYQLARAFPAAMAVLEPIIQRDPLIFKASLQTQAQELLVRPLMYLNKTGVIDITSPLRQVFVIDGLDECEDSQKQALIIRVVATILCDHNVPIWFLISSRPEMAISRALQRENRVHSILSSIMLDNNAEANSDIRQYIEDSFLDILDTHPLRNHIPPNWPDRDSINQLVWNSSGHFIYAATSMKFISSTDEHPARALQVVEGLTPSRVGNPFAELDTLYLHILTSAKYSSQVLRILRHCIFTGLNHSVTAVCFMYPDISPEDITLFLSDVQALVCLSPNDAAEMCVSLRHASLSDFFMDAKRSHAVYMSKQGYIASLLPRYFRLLDNGHQPLTSSVFYGRTLGDYHLIPDLITAVTHSQDIELLQSLITGHSPRDVWNFCMECWVHQGPVSSNEPRDFAIAAISGYTAAIRDSAANHDNNLYIHQFRVFMQVLMDDLNTLVQTEPQRQFFPALMLSSNPPCLTFLAPFLIRCFPQLQISSEYIISFLSLRPMGSNKGEIDHRSFEAVRSLPQSQLSWGSDLATALKVVLRHLVGYSWTPECLYPNPHERRLRQKKPLKYISQGSPKLSSVFYSHLRRLPRPQLLFHHDDESFALKRCGYSGARARKIGSRREQCFVLLMTVICYLHKCDRTSELAKLSRRSLPRAALWFPSLMKRARAKMDAYVLRWEESPDGLLEKAQSLSINEVD